MERSPIRTIDVIQACSAVVLFWMLARFPTPWTTQRYLGTVLALGGFAGIVTARYQLGRSFSVRPEARQLVTGGIYSKIRNPIYVFGTVLFSGVILVVQRPRLWLLLAVLVTVQVIRARKEAQVLEDAFGEAYRDYRRKTWF
jgi:protein-S-isoprenylcysteine O-methyltransferase Ste14